MKIIGATVEENLPFDLDRVRKIVAAPAMIVNWHPWVEEVSLIEQQGALFRKAVLAGSQTEMIERFWSAEDATEFHFQTVKGLWAEHHYRSRIRLVPAEGKGCLVNWEGRLIKNEEEDESEQMEAFYREGLNGMRSLLLELN